MLVLQAEEATGRIRLNAGYAHGLCMGGILAVYPLGCTDLSGPEKRMAIVKLVEVDAAQSVAQVLNRFGTAAITSGTMAVPLDPGAGLIRRVQLECADDAAWREVRRFLATYGGLQEASDGPVHYRVRITPAGDYQICDGVGMPLPNLDCRARRDDDGAASRLVQTLDHLSRYHKLLELGNSDATSPLAGKLVVELKHAPPGFRPSDVPQTGLLPTQAGPVSVQVGQWTFLYVRNVAPSGGPVLNFAILDLQPDWGVSQLYPQDTAYRTLDPGQEERLVLRFDLPEHMTHGTDYLQVIATTQAADFRWLAMAPLPPSAATDANSNGAKDGLRHANVVPSPSTGWTSAMVEVRVRR